MNAAVQPAAFNLQPVTRTHPITAGTRNVTLNMPSAEASLWERLTDRFGKRSRNEFLSLVLGLGLERLSEEAEHERQLIRRRFFNGAAASMLLGLFIVHLVFAAHKDARRVTRRGCRRIETLLVEGAHDDHTII